MAETYCGKKCSECSQKELLSCPGCMAGPGRLYGGDCRLAECVRAKGYETCDACGFNGNCETARSRFHHPEYLKSKQESALRQKQAYTKRASILGKWLWLLFWLIVPSAVAGIMGSNIFLKASPGIYMAGQILSSACSLAYGILLLKAASEEGRYRTAGICTLVGTGVNVLFAAFPGGVAAHPWMLILAIPVAVIELVGEYNEFQAHAAVLYGIANHLSNKWDTLWKWYLGLNLGLLGCAVLVIIPFLGAIAYLAYLVAAIGVIVVGILKLVYLYKTAKVFRDCTEKSSK